MKVKKFNRLEDYERIIDFLTEEYKINNSTISGIRQSAFVLKKEYL